MSDDHAFRWSRMRPVGFGVLVGAIQTIALLWPAFQAIQLSLLPADFHAQVPSLSAIYLGLVDSVAILLILGSVAIMAYFLGEVRDGLLGLVISMRISFPLTSLILMQLPSINPTSDLVTNSFAALSPNSIMGPCLEARPGFNQLAICAPLFVIGLVILISVLGVLAVIGGAFLRDRMEPFRRVSMDRRFLTLGLAVGGLAVLWPISPPLLDQGTQYGFPYVYYYFLPPGGNYSLPIIITLTVSSILLSILGLRKSSSTTFHTGLLIIGSVVLGAIALVTIGMQIPPDNGPYLSLYVAIKWSVATALATPFIVAIGSASSGVISTTEIDSRVS